MKRSSFIAVSSAVGLGLTVIAVTLVPEAIASAGRPTKDAPPNTDRYRCFSPSDIQSFQSVDEHKIVVVSNRNEVYQLGVSGPCMGLDTSFAIGIRSRFGNMDICGPFDADIVYQEMGHERVAQCTITEVKHLTGDDASAYVAKPKPKPKS